MRLVLRTSAERLPALSRGRSSTVYRAAGNGAAPSVQRVALKSARRGARVTFRLSETATVNLALKRGKKVVVKSKAFQMRAGTRTVTLGRARLPRARYTVELQARDRFGNRSALVRKTSRIGVR